MCEVCLCCLCWLVLRLRPRTDAQSNLNTNASRQPTEIPGCAAKGASGTAGGLAGGTTPGLRK